MAPVPLASQFALQMAAITVGLPIAGVAFGVLVGALALRAHERARAVVIGLGLAAGMAAAYVGISGAPAWPPVDVAGWLPYAVGFGTLVFALGDLAPFPVAAAFALRLAALGGLGWLLFRRPAHFGDWAAADWGRWVGGPALLGAIVWQATARLAQRVRTAEWAGACTVALGALSALVLLHESARLAQWAGACAAATGACAAAALVLPLVRTGEAAVAAAMLALLGLAMHVHYAIDLPAQPLALVSLAPLAPWALVPTQRLRHTAARLAVVLALAGVLAALALWLGWPPPEPAAASGDAWGTW